MALKDTINALVELQQVDKNILRAKKAQAALDTGAAAEAAATLARQTYDARNSALIKLSTDQKDCELKLASLETKLKTYQQKLYQGTVSNPKELGNIEREIAMLERQRGDLDSKILELMEAVEQTTRDVELTKAQFHAAEIACKCAVEEYKASRERIVRDLKHMTEQRVTAEAAVDNAQLLKRYDELRTKSGGIGIARIAGQNCGGCGMTLPTAQTKLVRDGEEVQYCENCRRMLAPP